MQGQNAAQIKQWLDSASPDDVLTVTQAGLKRVGSLDQTYRDRFTQQAKSEPVISRLFEHA